MQNGVDLLQEKNGRLVSENEMRLSPTPLNLSLNKPALIF